MERIAIELAERMTDLTRAQDWTNRRPDIFYVKGNKNHHLGTIFFVHKRIISALMTGEFVSDRMSHCV
jgi:hypothetical protein